MKKPVPKEQIKSWASPWTQTEWVHLADWLTVIHHFESQQRWIMGLAVYTQVSLPPHPPPCCASSILGMLGCLAPSSSICYLKSSGQCAFFYQAPLSRKNLPYSLSLSHPFFHSIIFKSALESHLFPCEHSMLIVVWLCVPVCACMRMCFWVCQQDTGGEGRAFKDLHSRNNCVSQALQFTQSPPPTPTPSPPQPTLCI